MPSRGFVFIVDNDIDSAAALEELLKIDGYTIERMARGKDALEAIIAAEPNLVLLNAHLPDINPFTLQEQL